MSTSITPHNGPPVQESSAAMVPSFASTIESFRRGLEPTTFDGACKLANIIAITKMCGISTPEDALARVMLGRDLGLTAMQAVRGIYMVEGRPGLDASLMQALCMQSEECEMFHCVEDTEASVTYVVKRRGRPQQTIRWTIADAQRALLVDRGKDPKQNNWNKYPRRMLHARCKSEGAQREFSDRMFGMRSRDELEDEAITVEGVVMPDPVMAPTIQTDAFDAKQKDLTGKIAAASTKEDAKAIRDEIKRLKDDGSLPSAWMDKVTEAYNAKFAKKAPPQAQAAPIAEQQKDPPKSDPVLPQGREPGED